MRTARLAAIGAVLAFAALLAGLAASGHGVGAQADEPAPAATEADEPWSPFMMTYRETAPGLGADGAAGSQEARLDYTDRRHFRVTLLHNPALADTIGSTWTVDGDVAVARDLHGGQISVTEYPPGEGPRLPHPWLVPGEISGLGHRPEWQATRGEAEQGMFRRDEVVDGRREQEEIVYRVADGIPVRRALTVDGIEVRRIEVVSLEVGEHVATDAGRVTWIARTMLWPPPTPVPDGARIEARQLPNGWWVATARDVDLPCDVIKGPGGCGRAPMANPSRIRSVGLCMEPATFYTFEISTSPRSDVRDDLCTGREPDAPHPRRAAPPLPAPPPAEAPAPVQSAPDMPPR